MLFSPRSRSLLVVPVLGVSILLGGCATGVAESAAVSGDNPSAVTGPIPVPTSAPADDATAAVEAVDTAGLSANVAAQIDYALTYWSSYNPAYGSIAPTDCVNFASQTLLERGWTQDDSWYYDESNVWNSSSSWLSSTAFKGYLEGRPDLAVALDDTQRDQVAIGDIVQFDWDASGDRDHTGIVTRIEKTDSGTEIYYAGHTLDSDYRGVDESITVDHPGGVAYYWHVLTP